MKKYTDISFFLFILVLGSDFAIPKKARIDTKIHDDTEQKELGDRYKLIEAKPHLIIHAGPKKTGSTSIQCQFSMNAALLANYSPYRYIGRKNVSGCPPARDGYVSYKFFDDPFKARVEEVFSVVNSLQQNLSIPIISSESVSTHVRKAHITGNIADAGSIGGMVLKLREYDWDVKIILTYRRFYEWLPSYHNQKMKIQSSHSDTLQIDTKVSMDCFISLAFFLENPTCLKNGPWADYANDLHPIQALAEAFYNVLGINVDVWNPLRTERINGTYGTNPENEMIAMFSREMLPLSGEFYRRFVSGEGQRPPLLHSTSKVVINVWHLLLQAHREGLIPKTTNPSKAFKIFGHKSAESITRSFFDDGKIPQKCLGEDTLRNILDLSLRYEKKLFPDWSDEDNHRLSFNKYVAAGRFCQWDVKAILQNEDVWQFIKSKVEQQL